MTTLECGYCGKKLTAKEVLYSQYADLRVCSGCATKGQILPRKYSAPIDHYYGKTLGIEVECNPTFGGVCNALDLNCDIKADGSLRHYGVEFVSPILDQASVSEWTFDLCDALVDAKVYSRCGLHIWVGTQDKSWWDIQTILQYCIRWQKQFAYMVSPSRYPTRGHNVSGRPSAIPTLPLGRTKKEFLEILYGFDSLRYHGMSRMMHSKRANDQGQGGYPGPISRYWWMNVHGHFHRQALEIRLHHGTVDPVKILNWIDLWTELIDKVSWQNMSTPPLKLVSKRLANYYSNKSESYMFYR